MKKEINLKSKLIYSYLNVIVFLIFFQLYFQPELYSVSKEVYANFNKTYYLVSFIVITVNSTLFNFVVSSNKENSVFIILISPLLVLISIFIFNVEQALLIMSIVMYDCTVNINRIFERDDKIVLNTFLSSIVCVILYWYADFSLDMSFVIALFVSILISYKELYLCMKYINFVKLTKSLKSIFYKSSILTVTKNVERSGDKIIINYLGLSLGLLPILNLSGLILMPVQTISKVLMTNEIKNPFSGKFNKLTTIFIFVFIYCVLFSLVVFLSEKLYGLPYSETAFYVSIVIFYKIVSSVDVLLYSRYIRSIVPNIKGSVYFIILLFVLMMYDFCGWNIIISIATYVFMSSLYTLFLVRGVYEK